MDGLFQHILSSPVSEIYTFTGLNFSVVTIFVNYNNFTFTKRELLQIRDLDKVKA